MSCPTLSCPTARHPSTNQQALPQGSYDQQARVDMHLERSQIRDSWSRAEESHRRELADRMQVRLLDAITG